MNFSRRATLALLAALPLAATAQATFPDKPIRIIIPVPAGGQTDILARLLGQKLTASMGQPVIVESKPGAATVIATEMVAKSPPDGYTLLLTLTQIVQAPLLMPRVKYDVFKDVVPVIRVAESTAIFAVPVGSPLKSIKDFVEQAKNRKVPFSYGSNGHGSTVHLYSDMFSRQYGFQLTHAPYKGEAPIVPDLVSGRIDAGWLSGMTAANLAKDKKVRILATTGTRRLTSLPEVPTFDELGYKGLDADGWIGIFAPGGTPRPIVEKLAAELDKAIQMPDVRERIISFGLEPAGGTSDDFSKMVRRSYDQWAHIIKTTGIQLD